MAVIKSFLIFSLFVLIVAIIYEWNKGYIYTREPIEPKVLENFEPVYQKHYFTEEDCILEQVNKRFGEKFELGRYYKDNEFIPDDLLFKGSFVPIKYLKDICKLS